MKKLLVLPIILMLSLFLALPVSAADFSVECGSGCKKDGSDPLFSESEIWYPGKSLDRTFSLKNTSSSSKEMAIGVTGHSADGELEKVMTVEIVRTSNAEVIWPKDTLEKFYTQGKISMGTFSPDEQKEFAFKVGMDRVADNKYQNKKSKFDLILGFWEEEAADLTPTPTPGGVIQGASTQGWRDKTEEVVLGDSEGELGGGVTDEAEKVAGAQTQKACPFWWIVLLGQTLALGGVYGWWLKKNRQPGKWWVAPISLMMAAFLVDRYAHTHWYVPSHFCPFEPLFGFVGASLETFVYRRLYLKNKKRLPRLS